jgi:hypothetical protein
VPMRCKTSLLGNVSTRPLRAYCKECNRTAEQIETCGHMAIAPRVSSTCGCSRRCPARSRSYQVLVEQAFQGRMTALSQAFAYLLARRRRR